ncbi:MAG: hypothetical protein EOM24_05210 [Chloroflexia bacterium]|nr:hypothetical protein [Chloroflexia bacterium]
MAISHKITVEPHTLGQPVAPPLCVDRLRLYAQLDRWRELRALILCAPAGYGKTTLVSRWLTCADQQLPVAWLSLNEHVDAPDLFVRQIAAALNPLLNGIYDRVQSILEDVHPDAERAMGQLLLTVRAQQPGLSQPANADLLLVIDDLHTVTSPAVLGLLRRMIEHGPPNLHLLLLSREAPALPLARLYASEQIAEIAVDDLRFSSEELRAYLALRGFPSVSDSDLGEITRRSEGWITALQIVTLGLRKPGDVGSLIADLSADSRWLSTYMAEEVLAQQPEPVQRLLLYSSILDTFNAPLCAAVSGLADARQLLDQIKATNLFLISLDHHNEWFRYHHLFQRWLQRQLTETMGLPFVYELHQRAAAWHAQADELPTAIRHLRAANDDAGAITLAAARLPELIMGAPYRARGWLDLLPTTAQASNPALLLLRCRLEGMFDNQDLLTYVEQAEFVINVTTLPEIQSAQLRAELHVWRTVGHFLRGDLAMAMVSLEQSRADPTQLEAFAAATRAFVAMHLYNQAGRHVEAAHYADQALAIFMRERYAAMIIAIRREMAKQALRMGQSGEANRQVQLIVGEQHTGPFVAREMAMTYIFAVQNSYWQGDFAQARRYYQQGELLGQQLQDAHLLALIAALGALYAAEPADADAPIRISAVPVLPGTLRMRVSLQITLLLHTQRYDEAWHLASGLGVDLESDPASKSHSLLIPFLQAYIARGLNLAAISPLLKRGLQWYSQTGDCFNELRLLTFRAWQQLRLGRRRDALVALDQALQLANATGYTHVVREIPELLPLVDQGAAQLLRVHDSIGSDRPAPTAAGLTHQEQAVLRLLAEDYRYEQIAHELTISVNTVRTHIRNSYAKLGVNRRAGAIARARELGLL